VTEAVNPILLKRNDPDDLPVRTALVSLMILGIAHDVTRDSISELVRDAAKLVMVYYPTRSILDVENKHRP
jgi:hypothetical protein